MMTCGIDRQLQATMGRVRGAESEKTKCDSADNGISNARYMLSAISGEKLNHAGGMIKDSIMSGLQRPEPQSKCGFMDDFDDLFLLKLGSNVKCPAPGAESDGLGSKQIDELMEADIKRDVGEGEETEFQKQLKRGVVIADGRRTSDASLMMKIGGVNV